LVSVFQISVLLFSFAAASFERSYSQQSQKENVVFSISTLFHVVPGCPQLRELTIDIDDWPGNQFGTIPRNYYCNTRIKRINKFLFHSISNGNQKCKQTLGEVRCLLQAGELFLSSWYSALRTLDYQIRGGGDGGWSGGGLTSLSAVGVQSKKTFRKQS